jgi:hypothetical protein
MLTIETASLYSEPYMNHTHLLIAIIIFIGFSLSFNYQLILLWGIDLGLPLDAPVVHQLIWDL